MAKDETNQSEGAKAKARAEEKAKPAVDIDQLVRQVNSLDTYARQHLEIRLSELERARAKEGNEAEAIDASETDLAQLNRRLTKLEKRMGG